jgi:hypothetical protein
MDGDRRVGSACVIEGEGEVATTADDEFKKIGNNGN